MVGDATCRMETRDKYKKTKSVALVDAATFVCCHNVAVVAPSPAQAPETSCVAVSFCGRESKPVRASRCVMKTNNAV